MYAQIVRAETATVIIANRAGEPPKSALWCAKTAGRRLPEPDVDIRTAAEQREIWIDHSVTHVSARSTALPDANFWSNSLPGIRVNSQGLPVSSWRSSTRLSASLAAGALNLY